MGDHRGVRPVRVIGGKGAHTAGGRPGRSVGARRTAFGGCGARGDPYAARFPRQPDWSRRALMRYACWSGSTCTTVRPSTRRPGGCMPSGRCSCCSRAATCGRTFTAASTCYATGTRSRRTIWPPGSTPTTPHRAGDSIGAPIASGPARGMTMPDAVGLGKGYIVAAVAHSYPRRRARPGIAAVDGQTLMGPSHRAVHGSK